MSVTSVTVTQQVINPVHRTDSRQSPNKIIIGKRVEKKTSEERGRESMVKTERQIGYFILKVNKNVYLF